MSPVRFALCGVLFEERLDRRYPGLAHVDGRAEDGRLLKGIGNGILDHLRPTAASRPSCTIRWLSARPGSGS